MEHSYRKFAHVSSVFSQCHDRYREHNLQKITGTSTAESHLCNSFCLGWWPDQCIENAIEMDRPTSGSFLFAGMDELEIFKFNVHVPTVLGQAKSMVETSTSILLSFRTWSREQIAPYLSRQPLRSTQIAPLAELFLSPPPSLHWNAHPPESNLKTDSRWEKLFPPHCCESWLPWPSGSPAQWYLSLRRLRRSENSWNG